MAAANSGSLRTVTTEWTLHSTTIRDCRILAHEAILSTASGQLTTSIGAPSTSHLTRRREECSVSGIGALKTLEATSPIYTSNS